MDFKKVPLKSVLLASLAAIFLIGFAAMKLSSKADIPVAENTDVLPPAQEMPVKELPEMAPADSSAIQEQLDHDRQEQKQTKDLKIKLEQINLELEQEKARAEINKFKKENIETFDEPAIDGQKNLPDIKVDYIGGDSVKKEAILSIGGISYQVKEKSNPTRDIQVMSISDSSVTLHVSAPEQLTKIIDYKPE